MCSSFDHKVSEPSHVRAIDEDLGHSREDSYEEFSWRKEHIIFRKNIRRSPHASLDHLISILATDLVPDKYLRERGDEYWLFRSQIKHLRKWAKPGYPNFRY